MFANAAGGKREMSGGRASLDHNATVVERTRRLQKYRSGTGTRTGGAAFARRIGTLNFSWLLRRRGWLRLYHPYLTLVLLLLTRNLHQLNYTNVSARESTNNLWGRLGDNLVVLSKCRQFDVRSIRAKILFRRVDADSLEVLDIHT